MFCLCNSPDPLEHRNAVRRFLAMREAKWLQPGSSDAAFDRMRRRPCGGLAKSYTVKKTLHACRLKRGGIDAPGTAAIESHVALAVCWSWTTARIVPSRSGSCSE
ncbi:hypothetical protein CIC12_25665 [Burkholderia sp. SG-MS1]|nr:hypothetical protein [Paraburkholderia sp. SG-MS1]